MLRRTAGLRIGLRTGFLSGLVLVLAAGCQQSSDRGAAAADSTAASAPHSGVADAGEHAGDESAAGHAATDHANAEGLPLLPIMQRLGSEMTALTHALMTDDYETVTRSAAAIATHVPISTEELQRIRRVLGAEMAAFEAVDESVHVASVRLHEAAQARELGVVVDRLGDVQRGCVSCHVQFRERLRLDRVGR